MGVVSRFAHKCEFHLSDRDAQRALAGQAVYGLCYCGAQAVAHVKRGIRSRELEAAPAGTIEVEVEEHEVEAFMAALAENGFESDKGES